VVDLKDNPEYVIPENSKTRRVQSEIGALVLGRLKRVRVNSGFLLIPPVIFIIVFLGYPLFNIFVMSIYNGHFTGEYYARFFSESLYIRVLLLTLKTGAIVTAGSVIRLPIP